MSPTINTYSPFPELTMLLISPQRSRVVFLTGASTGIGLTDTLRFELMPFGVEVISVRPGPINTEIWDKVLTPEESPLDDGLYRDYSGGFTTLS